MQIPYFQTHKNLIKEKCETNIPPESARQLPKLTFSSQIWLTAAESISMNILSSDSDHECYTCVMCNYATWGQYVLLFAVID